LFAGLSPARLEVPAGVCVDCMQALGLDHGEPSGNTLDYRADGSLEGGVLPPRTVTTLVTCQQAPARERLRFRARADRWEVLADGAFAPQPGKLVLCDDRGQCFALDSNGLQPVDPERAAEPALLLVAETQPPTVRTLSPPAAASTAGADSDLPARLRFAWGGDVLPRGSYVGVFAAAPWLPDHGLHPRLHRATHLVFGRCAAEDFAR